MQRAWLALIVLLLPGARAAACPELPIAPDAPNPYELQFGATNVNGALGNGALTAAFSRCGELTVFKWPGPSYYNQLAYLTDNATTSSSRPRRRTMKADARRGCSGQWASSRPVTGGPLACRVPEGACHRSDPDPHRSPRGLQHRGAPGARSSSASSATR